LFTISNDSVSTSNWTITMTVRGTGASSTTSYTIYYYSI
jgi:hypothetical protein